MKAPTSSTLLPLLLVGCAALSEPAVSSAELDFGRVPVGRSELRSVVFDNPTDGELQLSAGWVYTGPRAGTGGGSLAAWTLLEGPASVPAGASATRTVRWRPGRPGADSVRLRLEWTGEVAGHATILLRGEATPSAADLDGDGWSPATGDCDDEDPAVHPGAEERCDGLDDDCDGVVPDDERDLDLDGSAPCEGDCDDRDPAVRPGLPEVCDQRDTDCDGFVPDAFDLDGDGFSLCEGDCDDDEPRAHPGRAEECDDGVDNDCSGVENDRDLDRDGWSACDTPDCDDNPLQVPLVVDPEAGPGGDGSLERPLRSIGEAVALLDPFCPAVLLRAGEYRERLEWSDGGFALVLMGEDRDAVRLLHEGGGGALFDADFAVSSDQVGALELRRLSLLGPGGDCDAGGGRAVDIDAAPFSAPGSAPFELTLTEVRVAGFRAGASGQQFDFAAGGAVTAGLGTHLRVVDSVFEDNRACGGTSPSGGAVAAYWTASVEDAVFVGNEAERGGALFCANDLEIRGGLFAANRASGPGGAVAGGGLESGASAYLQVSLVVEGARFVDNEAGGPGGAISFEPGLGSDVLVRHDTFAGNRSDSSTAALAVVGPASLLALVAIDDRGTEVFAIDDDSGASACEQNTVFFAGGGAPPAIAGACADAWEAGDNQRRDPLLVHWTDDGDWTDDDLRLSGASPERGSGPDGRDRGWTGAPETGP